MCVVIVWGVSDGVGVEGGVMLLCCSIGLVGYRDYPTAPSIIGQVTPNPFDN